MKRLLTLLFFASLLLAQACEKKINAEESCNFAQNSYKQRVSWPVRPVVFYADPSLTQDQMQSLQKAMSVWNDIFRNQFNVPNMFSLQGSLQASMGFKQDGMNVVSITNSWPGRADEQAGTLLYWTDDHVTEADIQINGNLLYSVGDVVNPEETDMVALLVHELGHALGLLHITSADYTAMAVHLPKGELHRRTVGQPEVDALRCEY